MLRSIVVDYLNYDACGLKCAKVPLVVEVFVELRFRKEGKLTKLRRNATS